MRKKSYIFRQKTSILVLQKMTIFSKKLTNDKITTFFRQLLKIIIKSICTILGQYRVKT